MHADEALVNVNMWVTPDECNMDPSSGGLRVWRAPSPLSWTFEEFNVPDPGKLAELLDGAEEIVVPFRRNRAVLFHSNLFHRS